MNLQASQRLKELDHIQYNIESGYEELQLTEEGEEIFSCAKHFYDLKMQNVVLKSVLIRLCH